MMLESETVVSDSLLVYNRHLKVCDFSQEFLLLCSQETPDGFVCLDPIPDEMQMQTDYCSVLPRYGYSQRQEIGRASCRERV